MHKLSIYVETSVWSHAFAEDAPDLRRATLEFLEAARGGRHELFISEVVLEEMYRARPELSERLLAMVAEMRPEELDVDEAVVDLARSYAEGGAIPPAKVEDARHVAVAVVNEIDVLVSWNYQHLVNVNRRELFHHLSVTNGYYKPLHIVSHPEVPNARE